MTMNIKSLSDEELVIRVREEDQNLYEEVMKRYQSKLFRYARSIVGSDDDASDVVQEAFIKAFVKLNSFNAKRKFSSWMYRIVHNEAINWLKKSKSFISLEANEWLKEKLSGRVNTEREFEAQETKERVKKSLRKLPVEYRSVLSLYFLEDKSYEEISEVLKIPMGTVGVRMKRGKERMQKICSNSEGGV